MKRTRPHRVPLSAEALELIERLPRNGEHLFTINGNGKPIVAMSLRKALHRHGGDGFTVHGFRSAFRDWGGERTSAPRELLEVALAHAIGNQTEAGLRARRSAGEAAPRHAAMGDALRRADRAADATRSSRWPGAVAMDDAPKLTIADLIAWGRDWERHLGRTGRPGVPRAAPDAGSIHRRRQRGAGNQQQREQERRQPRSRGGRPPGGMGEQKAAPRGRRRKRGGRDSHRDESVRQAA